MGDVICRHPPVMRGEFFMNELCVLCAMVLSVCRPGLDKNNIVSNFLLGMV